MDRLAAETRELHRMIEEELELLDGRTSWLDYRLYLFRMYGFHVPVEAALAGCPGLAAVVPDLDRRLGKGGLLAHDLVALGVERRDLAQLPRVAAPALDSLPEALGWLYVVERMTLDNVRIARQVGARLPIELDLAGAYFACYSHDVAVRWRDLGAACDAFAARGGDGGRVVAAALDAGARLHRWLRPTTSARAVRAHA